jgi:general secretion pathway protein A
MYTSFFGLSEKPFAITPDPRFLYLSERHAEALAHLLYGINEAGGFIQLTGEVGTGKTTVVRTLLSRMPQHADVAVILNPRITPAEFLLTICEELGLAIAPGDRDSVKQMVDALNRRLLAAHAEGRRVIVIVDEAQNLSTDVLEQVRLLTNLETPSQKLLQIILIGQPELRDLLDRNELRQLAQRITGRYHLSPLSKRETKGYVRHRLRVAGHTGEIFTSTALAEVHRLSSGIPRVVNVCCDRALLGAYTQEQRRITAALVRQAASEVYGRRFAPAWIGWAAGSAGAVALTMLLFGGWHVFYRRSPQAVGDAALAARAAPDPAESKGADAAGSAADAAAGLNVMPAAAPPVFTASTGSANAGAVSGAGAAAAPLGMATSGIRTPGVATPGASSGARPSLYALLAANAVDTTDAAAYRRLLALWGTTLLDNRDPCGQAAKAGLACFDQRGSWAEVRMLNRPAILTLTDDHGKKHRVVLTTLSDQNATLTFGDHNEQIPLDEVSKAWFGDFTVVWRPKTRRPRLLSVGMSGEEVRWLRRSLNALQGPATEPVRSDLFDRDLAVAVENFQREHRLNVDGIAGIQTQIMLETALADPDSPLLLQSGERGG